MEDRTFPGESMERPSNGSEDDDVVQVEEAGFPVEASQDAVHEAGERSGGIAEAKRNLIKFK